MKGGAVLGPPSNFFCLSSVKACCKLMAPADWDSAKPWPRVGAGTEREKKERKKEFKSPDFILLGVRLRLTQKILFLKTWMAKMSAVKNG